jgi:uncharacterized protein (DUF433 family)
MKPETIEKVIDYYLEDYTFEEFLENFDLEPVDVFMHLYVTGMIDEEKMKEFLTGE